MRTFNFIKELSLNHDIHLVSFYESRQELVDCKQLEKYCKKIYLVYLPKWLAWLKAVTFYFSNDPSQVAYYRSGRMKRLIAQILNNESFDLAYIHLFRMFQYVHLIPDNVYKVTDLTDVISKEIFRSIGNENNLHTRIIKREATKIRKYEQMVAWTTNETWVISEQEKWDLIASSNCERVSVVKNGVNISGDMKRLYDDPNILFFGYYNTSHNKDALKFLKDNIMPNIIKKVPNTKLTVFGAGKWRTPKNVKSKFPVNYLGFISDLSDVFVSATVMVAPILYSAGTQNKILEAMNHGVPVITSNFGNEGIDAKNGTEIILCNSSEEYVTQICRIITDVRLNEHIGVNGQKYVRQNFSWDNVTKRVSEIEKTLKSQNLKPNS